MRHKLFAVVSGFALLAAAATPAPAANREHQQLMADIRMLQEQTQLLQNLLGQFNETLKAVNARLDQQSEANRKMAADQKLAIDNLTNDARVIREKLDPPSSTSARSRRAADPRRSRCSTPRSSSCSRSGWSRWWASRPTSWRDCSD